MSSDRWNQVAEVFQKALDLPPDQRELYLREECPDAALRGEVEALLAADAEADAFMEQPLVPASDVVQAQPPQRGRIGHYRLLRKLGEGGMSTVFLAVRGDDFRRRAAVKVIRHGMESDDAARRLRSERQILAGLNHPNIASLYEGGTTSHGLPYFVMEYVDGLPIDLYCDQHQLTLRERIELFCKICEAVHYAHQNLVVHRDLKPSNALVNLDGEPKLLDFGIAKLLNPELGAPELEPTATWHQVLTPHYASPEQLRGEMITTATDVYSLGVLLFKMLTGHLPHDFRGRTPREIEKILTEGEPPKPSTVVTAAARKDDSTTAGESGVWQMPPEILSRRLAGDLDNIVLKALAGAPRRRYGSAQQLADDLRRHVRGFPVLARPGGVRYRVGKFLRRNWVAVGAATLILALILAFAVATTLQAAAIARQRDRARNERDEKVQVLALVEEIFRLADPGEARGETFTVREALDRSNRGIERRLGEQPAVEAALRQTVGTIYLNLGLLDEARSYLTRVYDIRSRLYGDHSVEAAESLSALGAVFREMGRYEDAAAYSTRAVSIFRDLRGDDHPDLIRPLNNLVTLYCRTEDYEAADEPSREALELARRHLDDTRSEAAEAVTNRAVVLRRKGDLESAEEMYREGLRIQRIVLGEEHPEIANVLNNLAVVLRVKGDLAAAAEIHRETLALRRKLYQDRHPAVAQSLTNLASVLKSQGKYDEAAAGYREAIAILHETLGLSHPITITIETELALVLIQGGQSAAAERYAEAEELLERSFHHLRQQLGDEHSKTRQARDRLIALYESWDQPEKAAGLREKTPLP
ncbi:MAG TPA: serine/threonine-protein kinase [Thermoanaerobaculia bacterium]